MRNSQDEWTINRKRKYEAHCHAEIFDVGTRVAANDDLSETVFFLPYARRCLTVYPFSSCDVDDCGNALVRPKDCNHSYPPER